MRIVDASKENRDHLSAVKARIGAQCLSLYAISPRSSVGAIMLVVAAGSEDALWHCRQRAPDWTLANTTTRRVQRNVNEIEGIVAVLEIFR